MFDKAIHRIRRHFGIENLEDWKGVEPGWILAMDGIGQATLDHIRLYLAAKNVTLAGDQSAEHWNNSLAEVRIAKALTDYDHRVTTPFTVIIDTREQQPFGFTDIKADLGELAKDTREMIKSGEIGQDVGKWVVKKEYASLGNHQGDYSIKGFEGRCNIERKSMADAHGTILGWGKHRENFVKELENLASMECAAVVVECTFGELIRQTGSRGKKTANENRKILSRQVLAWQTDFRVPWMFACTRRMAEVFAFRTLQRFWKHQLKAKKQTDKLNRELERAETL